MARLGRVSPVSRGRKDKKRRTPIRHRTPDGPPPPPTPERIFDEIFGALRELPTETDPLQAELAVAELIGLAWQAGNDRADAEELFGTGLAGHARRRRTPVALALVRVLAAIAPREEDRIAAARVALELGGRGVAEAPWAHVVGQVAAGRCWAHRDIFGDQTSLFCEFAYGRRRHALVVLIDHNLGGIAKDAFITDEPARALADLRRAGKREGPLVELVEVEPGWARATLERAFTATDRASDPPVTDDFLHVRPIALARMRTMPQPPQTLPETTEDWTDERRSALVEQFLSSPVAAAFVRDEAARRVAHLLVEYGADEDQGRPLRVSPAKLELFLFKWLPSIGVDEDVAQTIPLVLPAFVDWAAAHTGMTAPAREALAEAASDLAEHFEEGCDDHFGETAGDRSPAEMYAAGLDGVSSVAELDDALERRRLAMPFFGTRIGGEDFPLLDPGDPDDRDLLILGEHPEFHDQYLRDEPPSDSDGSGLHLALHAVVANQLWDGEPVEAWQAAKRLLADGMDRHDVLHALCEVVVKSLHAGLTGARVDASGYRAELAAIAAQGGSAPRDAAEPVVPAPRRAKAGPASARDRKAGGGKGAYQIKVSLRGVRPPIWRRLRVPAGITLGQLHDVLQVAMGWSDYHMHVFEVGSARYGMPDPELGFRDDRKARLATVAPTVGSRLQYEYDFGDSWQHDIVVEEVLEAGCGEGEEYPVCMAGRRACPPEDCGGAWGYQHLLEVLADPTHEEHEHLSEWVGGPFEPGAFDRNVVNDVLRTMSTGRRR